MSDRDTDSDYEEDEEVDENVFEMLRGEMQLRANRAELREPEAKVPDRSRMAGQNIEVAVDSATRNKCGRMRNVFSCVRGQSTQIPSCNRGRVEAMQRYIPSEMVQSVQLPSRVFCGQFSHDGSRFVIAAQDPYIRIYATEPIKRSKSAKPKPEGPRDQPPRQGATVEAKAPVSASSEPLKQTTTQGSREPAWEMLKTIRIGSVGYAILDLSFSADNTFVAWSSWSNIVHLSNINSGTGAGDIELHEEIDLHPGDVGRFSVFSLKFSPDCKQILCGASDFHVYVYDLETKTQVVKCAAHDEDVNSVVYVGDPADNGGACFLSASDDMLCKMWDRRTVGNGRQKPVGVFAGHAAGIAHIASKNDGRYFISQGKDQCIKLWDLRSISDSDKVKIKRTHYWDYRYDSVPNDVVGAKSSFDTSLMTYCGHRVLETLIRCYFSPEFTTGQRYIYTGSQGGLVHVYDVLTGKAVKRLIGHRGVVRDVSWHPFRPLLASSSWDRTVGKWEIPRDIA